MAIDRDEEGVSGDDEYASSDNGFEPECSASEEVRERSDLECEFVLRDGSWWCTSHNCHA